MKSNESSCKGMESNEKHWKTMNEKLWKASERWWKVKSHEKRCNITKSNAKQGDSMKSNDKQWKAMFRLLGLDQFILENICACKGCCARGCAVGCAGVVRTFSVTCGLWVGTGCRFPLERKESLKSHEKQPKSIKSNQKQWKALKNNEKQWKAMRSNEKPWKPMKSDEKQKAWKVMKSYEKPWKAMNEKFWKA
jgi:hypothetical protein